jgi:hypothetical protein
VLVIFQQFLRQAHGPVGVMSDCAVDDLDLQHGFSKTPTCNFSH